MRKLALVLSLAVVPAAAALAQKGIPKRPKLVASADTNDARAYVDFGFRSSTTIPGPRRTHFYWSRAV